MSDFFEHLKIVALDKEATKPLGLGDMQNVVLTLSGRAPSTWCVYFNEAWKSHLYMMKRSATATGNAIQITCVPSELQAHHIKELNIVIAQVNIAYENILSERAAEKASYDEKERIRKEQLDNVGRNLKFD